MLWLLLACHSPVPDRVVVLGMDGLDYAQLDRMIAAGDLPHFRKLITEGARADMAVTEPVMSPILWSTLASGYPAEVHGVGGWADPRSHTLYTGADLRVKRVWDVASAAGQSVLVSGWLLTWPATAVHGALLSDRYVWTLPMSKGASEGGRGAEAPASFTTFPESLADQARSWVPDDAWLSASPLAYQVAAYGAPSHPLRRDETQVRVFERHWPGSDATFGALYLNGADQVSHLYWPFSDPVTAERLRREPEARAAAVQEALARHPQHPPPFPAGLSPTEMETAARYVPDYYRYLDAALGRILALLDGNTTLILCSDHGFQPSSLEPLLVGSHRPVAVFVAWGARVKPGKYEAISVMDMAPTLYALSDLPAAADMPGRTLTQIFEVQPRSPVASYVLTGPRASSPDQGPAGEALRRQLEALGYLDDQGEAEIGASRRER